MKEALDGYGDEYDRVLSEHRRIVTESTVTEDALRQEELAVDVGSKRPCGKH